MSLEGKTINELSKTETLKDDTKFVVDNGASEANYLLFSKIKSIILGIIDSLKVSKAGDTMTGPLKVPTASVESSDTTVPNCELVKLWLSTKADLENGKVPDSQLPTKAINAVQKTGDTMTGTLDVNQPQVNDVNGDVPLETEYGCALKIRDKLGNYIGEVGTVFRNDGQVASRLLSSRVINGETKYADVSVSLNSSGIARAFAPTPSATSNNTEIATTAWVNQKIQEISSGTSVPVGSLSMGPVASMSGYILCDGRAVSRSQYANLFTAIGTNFGAGDGSTTFNVPDYRGCFLRMAGGSAGSMYQKQPQGLPDVVGTFAVNAGGKYTGAFSAGSGDSYNLYGTSSALTQFHSSASNSIYGSADEVRPVNYAVNYFIKY